MSEFIKVTEYNLEEISKRVEVLEVLDNGIRFYGTRNGIVITEMLAKWGDSIAFSGDVIEVIHESFEKALNEAFDKTVEGDFVNLTEDVGVTDDVMEKVVSTMEKTKKVRSKKSKKVSE